MVNESWFRGFWRTSRKNEPETGKLVIGVLAFEVSGLMSKVIHSWQFLSDKQIVRLREDIMNSQGVRKLVSDDDDFLVGLACAEIIENFRFMARSVSRLTKRCVDPVLLGFEHLLEDLINNGVDLYGWEYKWKEMEKKAKKMEKFIMLSNDLYEELEVLAELEQNLRRMKEYNDPNQANLLEVQKKIVWQKKRVKNLQEISLWNRTYDYTALLLARSLFTIIERIKRVFGFDHTISIKGIGDSEVINKEYLSRSPTISALMQSSVHPSENSLPRFSSGPLGKLSDNNSVTRFYSGPLGRQTKKSGPIMGIKKTNNLHWRTPKLGQIFGTSKTRNQPWKKNDHSSNLHGKYPDPKSKQLANVGPFKGCVTGGNESPINGVHSGPFVNVVKEATNEELSRGYGSHSKFSLFNSHEKLLNPLPLTLGDAALALHYANVIIVIEKLAATPHLIGPDARDDLYNMLPTSVRASLKERLKSTKGLASSFYDDSLAAEWSEALARILYWLAPVAHNMIRWQSERNFEQQHLISRANVLLVQTLYFANREKTESVITELLVGLNYLWRFGREHDAKALMECDSNRGFDDYMDLK